jgi:ribosome biogenesis GTPase A
VYATFLRLLFNKYHTHSPDQTLNIQGSGCLGADTLLAMLKNYCRNADIKTAITVGIVGLPNVGKSSLINSLKRSRAAQVRGGVRQSVLEMRCAHLVW